MVLEAGCAPDDPLRLEVSHATPRAFRKVGDLALSPVGQFADWSQVAASKQLVFNAAEACLARDPSLLSAPRPPSPSHPTSEPPSTDAPWPWRFLLGIALGRLACAPRLRRAPPRTTALLLALSASVLILRALCLPLAFYHPNGQGAFWIGFALDANGRHASYGSGFRELYGLLAERTFASPETLVMGAQALLGALSPACAYGIARALGARRPLAWGAFGAVALSPLLARISQSQSYYGTFTSLLFLAAAILLCGVPDRSERPPRFVLAVIASGLLVAQAARVTPIGWLSAAILPLVILARPGPLRAQLRWTALAGAGIAATVALTSAPAMLGVLHGALGAQWLPRLTTSGASPRALLSALLPTALVLVLASRHRLHAATRALALLATLCLMDATCMVRGDPATFQRAFAAMWGPVLLALFVALLADLRTGPLRGAAAAASLAACALFHARTWREDTALPTNVLEARWAQAWRETLPRGAIVLHLARTGTHVLSLPLYGAHTRVGVEPWTLSADDPLPDLGALPPSVYYYHSSLCEAREARPLCARLLSRFGGAPLQTGTFPARASASTSFFEGPSVPVGLYRIQ